MDEINEILKEAKEQKDELKKEIVSLLENNVKELKKRNENLIISYGKIIKEQEERIEFLRSELRKYMLI